MRRTGRPDDERASRGLSNEVGGPFGKPGRPVKDPVGERLRIYRAAGPLVLARGVKRTTIRDLARASYSSPGGLYHYFRTKADLVLYGLDPEALSRMCSEAGRELAIGPSGDGNSDPATLVRLFVRKNLRMIEFVRPALHAAIELGRSELRRRLDRALRDEADSLVSTLRSLQPGADIAPETAEAIRRAVLALAVDETVTRDEAERQLTFLFEEILPLTRPAS